MVKCKVCGFRLTNRMKKCPVCGAMAGSTKAGKIDKNANLPQYFCPSCKAEIISEHRYCPACGIELKEVAKRAVSAADKGKILKLAADYLKLKKNRVLAWGILGLDVLTALFFIFQGKQRKEEHGNSEELTYAERNTKQDTVIISKPTVDNAANALGRIKETPLEAFKYEIRDDKYILTGLNDTTLTDIVIPSVFSEIEGKVDKDGNGIGVFFACKKLKSVIIPNSVTKIEVAAFARCNSLTNINIPNSVTEIGGGAFRDCHSLTNVTIPDSVTEIGLGAFTDCHSLTNVIIPNSVTKIGEYAFIDCHSLTNVTIPNSVTEIGWGAFTGCHSLTNVTIPNSVTKIGEGAFRDCHSLTNITIPNSVTRIGEEAFSYCKSLRSITIPKSVKIIGENIFSNCNSLKNVSFENPNITKSNIKRVFGDSPSFTEVKIGDKVVKLSELRLR